MPKITARDVLGPGSPLEHALAGYEVRDGQLAMAEAVESALDHDRPLFVEAGTGTGKTLAYLVPAVLSKKKVVISTATRTLQDQIFTKDLPLLREVLGAHGVSFTCALMKGLSNYLCRRRYEELKKSGEAGLMIAKVERWLLDTETGDRAELDLPEGSPLWLGVQSGSDTRIGAPCAHYEACFVTKMKESAASADIVIVNHHLYCADLALRRGQRGEYASVVPAHDAVIFDEAHKLEDIASDFFGTRISSGRVTSLARDARRSPGIRTTVGTGLEVVLGVLVDSEARFFGELGRGERPGTRRVLARADLTKVADAAGAMDSALATLAAAGGGQADESARQIGRRADEARADLAFVSGLTRYDPEDAERKPTNVAWIDVRERSASIGASAIDVAPVFREALFARIPAVICTSATLATKGETEAPPSKARVRTETSTGPISVSPDSEGPPSKATRAARPLEFFRDRLGAPPDAIELVIPSPFDFATRAGLYVARDLPEPSDPDFDALATDRIVELLAVSGGGALVLCTSNRAKDAFYTRLMAAKTKLPLFVQGAESKHKLLARFRAARDGVLVATMSLWEGVDVPGEALRMVILDRIPFAVPTDPVVMARCEAIEREGKSAFGKYSIPSAAITLKQGFGRLIRSRTDAGVVALLDCRAATKGYGKALLSALPPAKRLQTMDDVRAFWDQIFTPAE